MSKSKKILTGEISQYLNDELNDTTDPVMVKLFGGKDYVTGDFFFQEDSLRLRPLGYELLKVFFDNEEFIHDRTFHAGELIDLAHYMNAPFFIRQKKIVLFSNEHMVMCKLSGSVALWLKNLS
ncbi:hypothetical protein KA005_54355 [bacterium]|nr:hypothetical protein [bacterium]